MACDNMCKGKSETQATKMEEWLLIRQARSPYQGREGTMANSPNPMPELPRDGQRVRWRDLAHARSAGWLDVFGPGPFEVVRIVHKYDLGLASGLVLRTKLGEWEISEVWLALDSQAPTGNGRITKRSDKVPARRLNRPSKVLF
jgi:hypothetical protein